MSTGAKELGELIYQLGVQHANFQNEIAKKIDRAMAKAFDDGFALGRETGYQDAAKDVVDTDGVEVVVVDGTLPALMPPPDPKAN